MRSIIFYFLLAISVLLSCSNEKGIKSKEQKESDELEEYIQNIRENKKNLPKAMSEKGIKLTINGPCDDALEDTIHENGIAYIDTIKIDNEVVVTFKFIEACCQEFLADYKTNGDTIIIELGLVNEEVCACICWYRYRFEAPLNKKKINHINVIVN